MLQHTPTPSPAHAFAPAASSTLQAVLAKASELADFITSIYVKEVESKAGCSMPKILAALRRLSEETRLVEEVTGGGRTRNKEAVKVIEDKQPEVRVGSFQTIDGDTFGQSRYEDETSDCEIVTETEMALGAFANKTDDRKTYGAKAAEILEEQSTSSLEINGCSSISLEVKAVSSKDPAIEELRKELEHLKYVAQNEILKEQFRKGSTMFTAIETAEKLKEDIANLTKKPDVLSNLLAAESKFHQATETNLELSTEIENLRECLRVKCAQLSETTARYQAAEETTESLMEEIGCLRNRPDLSGKLVEIEARLKNATEYNVHLKKEVEDYQRKIVECQNEMRKRERIAAQVNKDIKKDAESLLSQLCDSSKRFHARTSTKLVSDVNMDTAKRRISDLEILLAKGQKNLEETIAELDVMRRQKSEINSVLEESLKEIELMKIEMGGLLLRLRVLEDAKAASKRRIADFEKLLQAGCPSLALKTNDGRGGINLYDCVEAREDNGSRSRVWSVAVPMEVGEEAASDVTMSEGDSVGGADEVEMV
ncbi:hypothetical protein BC829DRAFT_416603 [Chytridium lagenaria]|nr:hypothetical protein BC829DRAFT_416603 [Chytridium lagenaria]